MYSFKQFFSGLPTFSNFHIFKTCYDSMLHVYNGLAKSFRSTPDLSSAYKKAEKHVCNKGCDLAGCAYDTKPKTTSGHATSWFGSGSLFKVQTSPVRNTNRTKKPANESYFYRRQ